MFDEQCLARFLKIESEPDREDLGFRLDRESRLGGVYAGVMVDHSQAGVDHSLRWDVLNTRLPAAKQHAKLSPRHRGLRQSHGGRESLQPGGRGSGQQRLQPWVIRHNKPKFWSGTKVSRRERLDGARILAAGTSANSGLDVPPTQLLPFFLAARSDAVPGHHLLGEALCSSYEAFRFTRENRELKWDAFDDHAAAVMAERINLTGSDWYLKEFDAALATRSRAIHPKMAAVVRRAVDLWECAEKVLVFAFYRQTCRVLRLHISEEIQRRMTDLARRRLGDAGRNTPESHINRVLESVQALF